LHSFFDGCEISFDRLTMWDCLRGRRSWRAASGGYWFHLRSATCSASDSMWWSSRAI